MLKPQPAVKGSHHTQVLERLRKQMMAARMQRAGLTSATARQRLQGQRIKAREKNKKRKRNCRKKERTREREGKKV